MIRIVSVSRRGPAGRCGLRPGMEITRVNGEPLRDFIDWEYWETASQLEIEADGKNYTLKKSEDEPAGMELDGLYPPERSCANHCVFCFVDQMPRGMRPTLYGKDDDWRYSLLFGNYVTLTNLGPRDFERIIARHYSPLNVSVHATDGETRARMMNNPRAALIMDQLRQLAQGGICFHCQVVLVPGFNDGAILEKTLSDLSSLYPSAMSIAVVPVGLTRFRDSLEPLTIPTAEEMGRVIDTVEAFAKGFTEEHGEPFAFCSDECYQLAGRPWPRYPEGFHTPQLSNGVGLLHDFLEGFEFAEDSAPDSLPGPRKVVSVAGVSMAKTLAALGERLTRRYPGLVYISKAVANRYFGETITVSGLMTAQDMLSTLEGCDADEVLIPRTCLRDGEDLFLDDMTLEEFIEKLGLPVRVVENDGADFLCAVLGLTEEEEELF